jgi:UDP-N-acetylmuramoylalanine--D-glutamate ligase
LSTVVYGLGESGIAATRTLLARGEYLRAVDAGDEPRLRAPLEERGSRGA